MVRLVIGRVETRQHAVACEVFDDATAPLDRGHDDRPVGVQHRDDLGRRVGLAEAREPGKIREQDADLALCAAQSGDVRLAAESGRQVRRKVRPKEGVEPSQLVGRTSEQLDLIGARAVATELGEDQVGRLAAFAGGGHRGDRPGLPPLDPGQRRLEIQPPERGGQRAAAAVLGSCAEGDRRKCDEHQNVPFPPADVPIAAEDDGHHRLAEEHQRDADREHDDAATLAIEVERPPRRERVERDADGGQCTERTEGLGSRRRSLKRRQVGQRNDAPDDHEPDETAEHQGASAQDGGGA